MKTNLVLRIFVFFGEDVTRIVLAFDMVESSLVNKEGVVVLILVDCQMVQFLGDTTVCSVDGTLVVGESRCRDVTVGKAKVGEDMAVGDDIFCHGISRFDLSFCGAVTVPCFMFDSAGYRTTLVESNISIQGYCIFCVDVDSGIYGRDGCILGSPVGVAEGAELGTYGRETEGIKSGIVEGSKSDAEFVCTLEIAEAILGSIHVAQRGSLVELPKEGDNNREVWLY